MPEFTVMSVIAVVAVIAAELFVFRTGIFRTARFWIAYAIILFFEVLVDGWLTKLTAPIVVYDEDQFTFRFPWDIPFEDFLFGFGMIILTFLFWERFKRQEAESGRDG